MVREHSKVVAVKWFDTRQVYLLSSIEDSQPDAKCRRWSKPHSKYIEVKQSTVVKSYNANMGGIDLLYRVIQ